MNTFVLKRQIFLFISAFYLLYVTLPLVGQLLPVSVQYISILTTITFVLLYPKAFNNKQTFWLFLYFGVLVVYLILGKQLTISSIPTEKGNVFTFLMESAFILPSFAICCVNNYLRDEKLIKNLFYTAIMGLAISFVYLIPMTILNSNILRMAMRTEYYEIDAVLGAPRYSLMHAYVIIAPTLLFACIVNKGRKKTISIIFFVMLTYMIFRTYISTTILLYLGMIGIVYLKSSGNTSKFVFRSIIMCFLLVFIMIGGAKILFDFSYDFFKGSYAQSKMDELGLLISGSEVGDNSLSSRENLYAISLRSFLDNPLIGHPKIGGHSNMLDRLGGMGLLCFIPYLMFVVSVWKSVDKQLFLYPRSRFYYRLGVLAVIILLSVKGLFSYEGWAFYAVILPVSALYLSQKERVIQNTNL